MRESMQGLIAVAKNSFGVECRCADVQDIDRQPDSRFALPFERFSLRTTPSAAQARRVLVWALNRNTIFLKI